MDAGILLSSRIRYFGGVIALVGLIACTPAGKTEAASNWLPTQVRSLDPAESTSDPIPRIAPSQDLIALYTRESETELQIRLDILELELVRYAGLPLSPTFDLYLELEIPATESAPWDVRIQVPSVGRPNLQFYESQPTDSIIPRVVSDQQLDTITVSIKLENLPNLGQSYRIRAFTTAPNSDQILDEIPAVSSSAVVEPVPLLLAFWHTLPAHTPAQALRRWDGAHTGPLGERHGLKHLLDASRAYQIPIALLDLKLPSSLAALDALGQTERIASMQHVGLLILPDALPENYFGQLPDWAIQRAAQSSRRTGLQFGIAGGSLWYAPALPENFPASYQLGLTNQLATRNSVSISTQVVHKSQQRLLSLPPNIETKPQATPQGLTLEIRRALLQMALAGKNQPPIAVLGGDLPGSTWGDPQATKATLAYIAQHPWIQVLDESDLRNSPSCNNPPCPTIAQPNHTAMTHSVLEALENSPDSSISDLAWQMFLDLSTPATPQVPELPNLRANYLGEIGNLLAAATWDENEKAGTAGVATRKSTAADCTNDPDFDGQPECTIANERFFALLDLQGGRLVLLFARTNRETVQLVGPSSQFVVGLSDQREWDLSAGLQADPAVIPGAFAEPWETYQFELIENGVRLIGSGIQKIYQLTEDGLRIEIHSEQLLDFTILLVVDPQRRFTRDWMNQYQEAEIPQGWVWGIEEGSKAEVRTSADLSSHHFLESQDFLSKPENPNQGYPSGHFIPFPLAVIKITAQNEFWVEIQTTE